MTRLDKHLEWRWGFARAALTLVVVLGLGIVTMCSAQAQTYKFTVLYSFTGGTDGADPQGVIFDTQGNLCGTTVHGGAHGYGTVFKLSQRGKETLLHIFQGGGRWGLSAGSLDF